VKRWVITGVSRTWIFAAFSLSLLIAAVAGPAVGRAIDRRGGRGILVISNVILAAGLAMLAESSGPIVLFSAWIVLGFGMALGLYDAAFATLAVLYGSSARGPITGITLFAGFASTVSWPLSTILNETMGWRGTCLAWAVINLAVALPLNRFLLPLTQPSRSLRRTPATTIGWKPYKEMLLLAFVFAAAWFVTGAMAAHLPTLLERAGATPYEAIAAAALVGPSQVAARLGEFLLLRRIHPLVSARIAAALHPIGAVVLSRCGSSLFRSSRGHGAGTTVP
jgi:MFS family permease